MGDRGNVTSVFRKFLDNIRYFSAAEDLELETNFREVFTITEKALTSAFTLKNLLRHNAKTATCPSLMIFVLASQYDIYLLCACLEYY